MSFQEKRAFVTIVSSTLIFVLYSLIVFNRYNDVIINSPNDLKFWAKIILVFVPIAAFAQIIVHIFFSIVNKIVTNENIPAFTDELDKLIELRATRISGYTFIIGFYLSMVTLVMGMQPYIMILTIIVSGYMASMLAEITKIWLYRKGV